MAKTEESNTFVDARHRERERFRQYHFQNFKFQTDLTTKKLTRCGYELRMFVEWKIIAVMLHDVELNENVYDQKV